MLIPSVKKLVDNAECCYAVYHKAKYRYIDCHVFYCYRVTRADFQSLIILNIIILNVVMLSVVM